ncbi:protein eyes shut-like isoform X2 [Prorops nasuta]|uniref:protein eyes shut-like isoform X2 n=1 Tax=Prorops nasuta TaxID=863751 RepID=UPI0034CD056E
MNLRWQWLGQRAITAIIFFRLIKSSITENCLKNPCIYGICLDNDNSSYSCYCIDGYTGLNCEINWDDCWSDPCLNGGTCSDAVATYNCTCAEGFIGTYCEIDASVCNATICKNSGICVEGPGSHFSCKCADGWSGAVCDEDNDECYNSPCYNGGLCINYPGGYSCACLFGFTGTDCDIEIYPCEENPCKNEAICLLENGKPECYCVPDYHGPFCELKYDDCQAKFVRCKNGGTCIDGINSFACICPDNYIGPTCDEFFTSTDKANTTFVVEQRTDGVIDLGTESSWSSTSLVSEIQNLSPSTIISTTTEYYMSSSHITTTKEEELSVEPGTESYTMVPTTSENTEKITTDTNSQTEFSSDSTSTVETLVTESTSKSVTQLFASTQKTSTNTFMEILVTTQISVQETEGFSVSTTTGMSDFNSSFKEGNEGFVSKTHTDFTSTPAVTTNQMHLSTQTEIPECIGNQCLSVSTELVETVKKQGCGSSELSKGSSFNGKSYARHSVTISEKNDGNITLKILLRVTTITKNGLILYVDFGNERYALVYLELGSLKLQFSCGLQTIILGEIDAVINNGNEVDIDTSFQYYEKGGIYVCNAKLLVNGSTAVTGEQILASPMNILSPAILYLGGIPTASFRYFPHVAVGFVGCMNNLKVNEVPRHFIQDSTEYFQIEECTSLLCLSNPCKNFGVCDEVNNIVSCRCFSGYSGKFCERSACDDNPCYLGSTCINSPGAGYVCICPFGSRGLLCEEDFTVTRPSFSVILQGYSSYVAYGLSNSIKDDMELKMKIIPRNLDQISLIAFLGRSSYTKELVDYLSITYVKGYIMLTWDLGSGVRRIFTNVPLTSVTSHNSSTVKVTKTYILRVGRKGRDAWLAVEGAGNVTGRAAGSMTRLDVSPILYIGGHKSTNYESLPHDLPLHTGFSGCIFDIELRIKDIVNDITSSNPATGRGVGECYRNECIQHSCKNGAVCLNHGPTYRSY